MGADQSAARMKEPAEHGARRSERRIGDDVERPAGEPQVRCICHDDHHGAPELGAQRRSPLGVPFDGDDGGAGFDERASQ